MDNKDTDSPIAPPKKAWSTPNFYLLGTDNVHGGPNAGLHEGQVVGSTITTGGVHQITTQIPGGAFIQHYESGTRLHYYS